MYFRRDPWPSGVKSDSLMQILPLEDAMKQQTKLSGYGTPANLKNLKHAVQISSLAKKLW
jgi:hypothetical protein